MKEDIFHIGVKALIRNDEGKILLLQVNKQQLVGEDRSYWDIPGGRIQRGDTVEETLRRELREETGITTVKRAMPLAMVLSNIRIPQRDGGDVGLVLSVYVCDVGVVGDVTLSKEHIAYKWATPSETAEALGVKYPAEFTEKIKALAK
jgi:8-oxo-dGTP diphosphatase